MMNQAKEIYINPNLSVEDRYNLLQDWANIQRSSNENLEIQTFFKEQLKDEEILNYEYHRTSPLLILRAVQNGWIDEVKLLLNKIKPEKKVDYLNTKYNNGTLLHYLIIGIFNQKTMNNIVLGKNYIDILILLRDSGIKLNKPDDENKTAFHLIIDIYNDIYQQASQETGKVKESNLKINARNLVFNLFIQLMESLDFDCNPVDNNKKTPIDYLDLSNKDADDLAKQLSLYSKGKLKINKITNVPETTENNLNPVNNNDSNRTNPNPNPIKWFNFAVQMVCLFALSVILGMLLRSIYNKRFIKDTLSTSNIVPIFNNTLSKEPVTEMVQKKLTQSYVSL
ncbi:MAG: hypothetical protein J0H68_04965 [Sphingobacteriia bacterium]|nr:hypothetical protein [Sphingobacteriia bacterium]